ncbi:MAG: PaaI family thioesterase, partial [Vulcanimicrobiaceae bacterium]
MTDNPRERCFTWEDPRAIARAVLSSEQQSWMRELLEGTFPAAPVAELVGMFPDSMEDGSITFAMHAEEWMTNPAGVIHGGMASTLLDTALTLCVIAKLPTGKMCTTLNLNVNFVRPLFPTGEKIVARGTVVHIGSTVATSEARLHDSRHRLIAHATATLAIID